MKFQAIIQAPVEVMVDAPDIKEAQRRCEAMTSAMTKVKPVNDNYDTAGAFLHSIYEATDGSSKQEPRPTNLRETQRSTKSTETTSPRTPPDDWPGPLVA